MKIVAIKDMSKGNAEVGEMWKETRIFYGSEPLNNVMDWVGPRKNIVLTIPDEEQKGGAV